MSCIVFQNYAIMSSRPSVACPALFSKTTQSCLASPLHPYHALILKIAENFPVGPLQPHLSFPPGTVHKCHSGSHLVAATSVFHCLILPPSGHYTVFPDSSYYPPVIPHSILSCVVCYLSELSSLPLTQNTRTTHHARLGSFVFDVILS